MFRFVIFISLAVRDEPLFGQKEIE